MAIGTLSSTIHFFNALVLKTGHPMLAVKSVGVMLSLVLMMLFIRLNMRKACAFLLVFYFYIQVFAVTLVYSDVLPDWL